MSQKSRAKKIRKELRAIYGRKKPVTYLVTNALADLRHLCDFANEDSDDDDGKPLNAMWHSSGEAGLDKAVRDIVSPGWRAVES
jgi:hypothetical protein